MLPVERRLVRHLVIAVLVKLLALLALWWWLVRDPAVEVDADRVAARLELSASPSAPSQGALK